MIYNIKTNFFTKEINITKWVKAVYFSTKFGSKIKSYLATLLFLIIFIQWSNFYIFSVIIVIYNTGRYLDQSIGSLLAQSIGYKEIELILENDGSTDNSEEICL